jgi:hypothetical protein
MNTPLKHMCLLTNVHTSWHYEATGDYLKAAHNPLCINTISQQ